MKTKSGILAAILFCAAAAYGQPQPLDSFTCVANAGTPVIVRVEGITELVGDLLLQCTGGSPVPSGSALPRANITVFLNTQVTSRVLSNGFNEASLFIDDVSSPVLCQTPASGCTATAGTAGIPNVYSGIVSGNSISFPNVSINPPGTGTMKLTFADIRANASQVVTNGVSGSIIPQVTIAPVGGNPITVFPTPISVKPGLVASILLTGGTTGLMPFLTPGVAVNGTLHMEEGFTNAWNQNLGHPISVLPGAGAVDPTRFGVTFFGPAGSKVTVPINIQSPWVFVNLSSTTSGAFSPINANTTLNGQAAFTTTFDPYGTAPQQGTTTLNWYGSGPSNFDPVSSPQVRSFDTIFSVLPPSPAVPGFQGYMIAVCNFQPAQGFAFISDVGARSVSQFLEEIRSQVIGAPPPPPAPSPERSPLAAAATTLPILTTVGSASFNGHVAITGDSLVSGFASQVAAAPASAATLPLPTSLGGISLRITDSAGTQKSPGLLYVAQQQVNYLMPSGLATGPAVVEVLSGTSVVAAGALDIVPVLPGMFSANANGSGVAAAQALFVGASGAQTTANIFQLSSGKYVAVPLDLTIAGQSTYLILYGTGFRNRSAQSAVSCQVGGQNVPVTYAAAQGSFAGLDQMNIGPLPVALAGKGEVSIQCLVDGAPTNPVTVAFK